MQKRDAVIEQKLELEARLKKVRAKELRQKENYESGEPQAKRTVICSHLKLKSVTNKSQREPKRFEVVLMPKTKHSSSLTSTTAKMKARKPKSHNALVQIRVSLRKACG